MKTYALFGSPVTHSLSPLMHNAAFIHRGIEARYLAIEAAGAQEAMTMLGERNISGASITIPLKTTIGASLDDLSENARRIGAVNTILREGSRLLGENTDCTGIDRALRELLGDPAGKVFLIVGAGGTARSALHAVLRAGGEAVVTARRETAARSLAAEFSCRFHRSEALQEIAADCFINTTPLGMKDFNECSSPLDRRLLGSFRWGLDAVYRPLETKLVRDAREEGCQAVGGLGMFIHQGAEQFRLWTGEDPPTGLMRDLVRKELEDEESKQNQSL